VVLQVFIEVTHLVVAVFTCIVARFSISIVGNLRPIVRLLPII